MDFAALKTELTTDPKALGYAPYLLVGNDVKLAELINASTGPGVEQVQVTGMDRDGFLLSIVNAYLNLPTLSSTIQSKWDRILGVIRAANQVDISSASIQGLLAQSVTDGVLSQTDVDMVNKRSATRAEVLFGLGVTVTVDDVTTARKL